MAHKTLYLDASTWMKLYVPEAGSEHVESLISAAERCTSHLITYAEMRATFAKAQRMGRMNQATKDLAVASFESDWQTCQVIDVRDPLIRRAGDLAERFGLRGYDSVHLAAAEAISLLLMPETLAFVCFDERLNAAARALGMATMVHGEK